MRPVPSTPTRTRTGRLARAALLTGGALAGTAAAAVGSYVRHNLTSRRRELDDVADAGFVERQVVVDGRRVNYAEGPDNGAPVVLLHGQGSRWQDASPVLPVLAEDHHVFAVDVPGHGDSDWLPAEEYTNARVGEILAGALEAAVGEPAIVSGHSSGGLLALWIAAHRPDLVSGLLLEDPPLFSSEMPRLLRTTGGTLPRLAEEYLATSVVESFQRYFVARGDYFAFFGPLEQPIVDYSLRWLDRHPDEPLRLFFLPPFVTVFFEGLVRYDPAFGAAWVRDLWYEGFDTATALSAVTAPTVLLHTNYFDHARGSAYQDGILMAAMDSDDVERALRLLPGADLLQVASGHLVHVERPNAYLDALFGLSEEVNG